MASAIPVASGKRRFAAWIFGVFFALMAVLFLASSFRASLLLLVAAAVTLPPSSRRLQKKISVLSRRWVRILVVVIALSTSMRLIGELQNTKLQLEQQQPVVAQQTSSAPRVRTPMIFDVPSLVGMTVSEVKTALGKPTETSKRINADDHDAYILYTRDGQDLMVSFDYGSNIVKDFFLSSGDPSGATQDTTRLMDRANLTEGDARYKIEFIQVLNDPSSYTGVQVMAAAVAQQEDDLQKQNDVAKKDNAEKELKEVMDLGIKANLVESYEFSDKASVVYVSSVWYAQTVAFKKDFLAKTAMLKKAVTGYGHFEVRDAHSNEKVAEVTAFSQSLEVYK